MIARPQVTAASTNETMTLGPAKFAAACAPTEKMPAPTATAMPMRARSHVPSERRRLRSSSPESAIDASTDFTRQFIVPPEVGRRPPRRRVVSAYDVHGPRGIRQRPGERRVDRERLRELVDREAVLDGERDREDELARLRARRRRRR
jgi:hypothetical protein